MENKQPTAIEQVLTEYVIENANKLMKRFDFLIKDESYLSLVYTEIAVIKEAEMQERMDRLENKLEELLDAN